MNSRRRDNPIRHIWNVGPNDQSHGFRDCVVKWDTHERACWITELSERAIQRVERKSSLLNEIHEFDDRDGRDTDLVAARNDLVNRSPCRLRQSWIVE
jgi:hypothetical protein